MKTHSFHFILGLSFADSVSPRESISYLARVNIYMIRALILRSVKTTNLRTALARKSFHVKTKMVFALYFRNAACFFIWARVCVVLSPPVKKRQNTLICWSS